MAKRNKELTAYLDKLIGEPMTLGRFLKSHREDEGLSLADMAKELGVSRQHLHAVERGKGVSVARAVRWGELLGYFPDMMAELALQSEIDAAGLSGWRVKLEHLPQSKDAAELKEPKKARKKAAKKKAA